MTHALIAAALLQQFSHSSIATDLPHYTRTHLLHIEIARTPTERTQGLMYRPYLSPYSGMLFIFSVPQKVGFWMKNTLIPLDIRYYNANGDPIQHIPYAPPCTQTPCPIYSSQKAVKYVLEQRAYTSFPSTIPALSIIEIPKKP